MVTHETAATHLQIRNLSKTFSGARALRNVDFGVRSGEVHGLVGATGSGESTLVESLAGVHQPDDGCSAELRGEPFTLGSAVAAERAGMRFVHQDLGLVSSLNAADNFALGSGFPTSGYGRIRWKVQYERTA